MPAWNYSNTAAETTLSGSIGAPDASIVVLSATGLPVTFPYSLVIDYLQPTAEIVTVNSAVGTTLAVTRGQDGTAAQAHTAGARVVHAVVARDLREASLHGAATTDVHGIGAGAAVVGTTTAQTLTGKTINGGSNTIQNVPASQVNGTFRNLKTEAFAAGDVAMTVDAAVGQTADLQQWRDSADVPVMKINAAGEPVLPAQVRSGGATNINANTTVTGTLAATGALTAQAGATVTGTATATTVASTGATNVGGNLAVTGTSNLTGAVTANGGVTSSGTITGGTVAATGNATVGGTLTATGAVTANAGVTSSGTVTGGTVAATGALTVGGNITWGSSVSVSTFDATSTGSTLATYVATGVGRVFVAPPSGKVLFHLTATVDSAGGVTTFAIVSYELRNGAVIGSGTVVTPTHDDRALWGEGNFGKRHSIAELITGLTPGNSYNIQTFIRTSLAGTNAVVDRQNLIVTPVL